MKLILSSCDFRNGNVRKTIIDNLSKPISQCKLLYIPNEKATFETINDAELSAAEYARLAERGYISVLNENDDMKIVPRCVILENTEIKSELLAVGDKIKEKHWEELCRIRDNFIGAVLDKTPPHLHKARIFGLQHTFFSDPWFILYVLNHLTENGKLKPPTVEQKKMLMTVIAIDK